MRFADKEAAVNHLVQADLHVESLARALREEQRRIRTLVENDLLRLEQGTEIGGAMFMHDVLKGPDGDLPLVCRVLRYDVLTNGATVEVGVLADQPGRVLMVQDMTLVDLLAQVGEWIS